MSIIPQEPKVYDDGRTKQSFRDSTDINKILQRHARMGTLSHLEKWGGQYGDFAGFNFQEAQNQIAKANSMFEELPSEVRREFGNRPDAFLAFVTDPENEKDLATLLPALAAPGRQLKRPPPSADNPPPPDPVAPEPPTP